jgi:hypothetical protein
MKLKNIEGRMHWYGFFLSLTTAILWGILPFFCCGNNIVAYGAFTEALNIWQAAKVIAVLAMAPIFNFLSMLVAG